MKLMVIVLEVTLTTNCSQKQMI